MTSPRGPAPGGHRCQARRPFYLGARSGGPAPRQTLMGFISLLVTGLRVRSQFQGGEDGGGGSLALLGAECRPDCSQDRHPVTPGGRTSACCRRGGKEQGGRPCSGRRGSTWKASLPVRAIGGSLRPLPPAAGRSGPQRPCPLSRERATSVRVTYRSAEKGGDGGRGGDLTSRPACAQAQHGPHAPSARFGACGPPYGRASPWRPREPHRLRKAASPWRPRAPAACIVPLGPPLPGRAGEDGLWAGTGTHWERLGAPGDGRWGALETLGHRALAGPERRLPAPARPAPPGRGPIGRC
ncbi:unnamed protein product [Rangifer tarandus platyrhynchus]|uniref:Uncharacterized protein n=2 Tax=Rangifer tarandus platyrhynchus TaxID=3082113 RepID=A0ABN9A012_RANTA|nr:unnamed protein product [Rangifer tarandus platyrhynchus]CAI9711198.1 unnamed protein product [Rangifer tarandus platyrhynchus]